MSKANVTKAVVYCRRSTNLTNSIDSQVSDCKSLVLSEYGNIETLVFVDEGISGSLGIDQREGLSKAIEELGENVVLVSVDVSRLARSIYVQLDIERAVASAKATLHLADTGIFGLTPENELQSHMLAAFAEYYRQATRHKIKSALSLKKRNGQILGRPKAFCDFNDNHTGYVVTQQGQMILHLANQQRANGATWREVASLLNSMSVTTTWGTCWNTNSIRHAVLSLRDVA